MKHCLIVDDSRVVRKVARRIIEELHFECEEAEDGQKALELCERKMPDVVIIDWNMPIMSGLELLRYIRQMESGKDVKIVFCTTENSAAQIQKALDASVDEYIMKPFDSEIIETKFKHIGLIDL